MPIIPVSAIPASSNGFYATNNEFLINGPRGFTEFRLLENEDLFVRMEFPGVPEDGVRCCLDKTKKEVIILASAPEEHEHDSSSRKYLSTTGLVCDCSELTRIQSVMTDGVLRLILSKKKIDQPRPSNISFLRHRDPQARARGFTDPRDPTWTGQVIKLNPFVLEGPDRAFESKQLRNGGLYLRFDMPGVPKDRVNAAVHDGIVSVVGRAPAVGFDSSGRDYSAKVALLNRQVIFPSRWIKTIANGVIPLAIPPV